MTPLTSEERARFMEWLSDEIIKDAGVLKTLGSLKSPKPATLAKMTEKAAKEYVLRVLKAKEPG